MELRRKLTQGHIREIQIRQHSRTAGVVKDYQNVLTFGPSNVPFPNILVIILGAIIFNSLRYHFRVIPVL